MIRKLVVISWLAPALLFSAGPRGCTGSATLGTFRIAVRRSGGGPSLPVKSVSVIPAGAHLIWDPAHLSPHIAGKGEVTAILAPSQNSPQAGKIFTLRPEEAGAHIEWELPISPSVIALVIAPQGLNMNKVTSMVKRNEDMLEQLADYAEQTSEVEALVQQLADSEDSGVSPDAALKGFSSQYGVSVPKLDTAAPSSQQASLLLRAVLPSSTAYDPLAPASAQVEQSVGLAATVAAMFFGNGFGLAAGGTALVTNLRTAVFPGTELRSAFAQSVDKDSLALCTKTTAAKARTRFAYLWAYRVPGLKPPVAAITGDAHLPLGSDSAVACTGPVKELSRAHDWKLAPLAGGAPIPVTVSAGDSAAAIKIDLSQTTAPAGDYRLTALWDWDSLSLGKVSLRPLADFKHVAIAPESRDKLVAGNGPVAVKLTGADFEFVEKVSFERASGKAAPKAVEFELPKGRRAGDQEFMTVDIDTATPGAYRLLLAQSDDHPHPVPLTILPPSPTITNLPLHVNTGEGSEALCLEGAGLDQIDSISSAAGAIIGKAGAKSWTGEIKPKAGLQPGATFALVIKVKGLEQKMTFPDAIDVVGPRPRITAVRRSVPGSPGIDLREGELPSGTTLGMELDVSGLHESAHPKLELSCRPGEQKRAVSLSPDEPADGISLSFAGPSALYLSLDVGTVGFAGCGLQATIKIEPEGRSDPAPLGRVVRVPRLEQFTLTSEPLGPSIYAGVLRGSDLDLVERTGWDAEHSLAVDAIPAPVPGMAGEQTLRVPLPWPSPAPHAPLYVWLRGEKTARRTSITD